MAAVMRRPPWARLCVAAVSGVTTGGLSRREPPHYLTAATNAAQGSIEIGVLHPSKKQAIKTLTNSDRQRASSASIGYGYNGWAARYATVMASWQWGIDWVIKCA